MVKFAIQPALTEEIPLPLRLPEEMPGSIREAAEQDPVFNQELRALRSVELRTAMKINQVAYGNWKNALRISNDTVQLIVLTDVGPRILFYGFSGEQNEFHEVTEHAGKTGGDDFRSYGGHRLWVSPEIERTYYPDNLQVSVSQKGDRVVFASPIESMPPGTNLQKEIEIDLDETGTHVTVTHRIANRGNDATDMAPWALSVMATGGRAILPLSPKAPMSKDRLLPEGVLALWSYTDLADPRWILGSKYIQLKQDTNPTGKFKEQMTGIYNPSGWGAYYREGHLFIKSARVEEGARYPDFGCNFELYTEPGFLELETLGPLRNLKPGEAAQHIEEWWLFKDVPGGNDDTWVDDIILPIIQTIL